MWNVNELFRNTVNQTPNRTAVVDPVSERRFSYAELDEKVEQVAAGLRAFGIEKGDRVGAALPNTPEHVFLFLAVQRVGAVAVPFDYRITDEKLRYFVSDAELSLLAFGETVAEQVVDLREELDCDTFVTTADVSASGVDEYETLVQEPDGPITTKVHSEDLSVVQYSSGTTGDPKGIKITHRGGINRAFLNIHTQEDYDRETILGTIPLYHTIAVHGNLLPAFVTGGTYVLLPHSELDVARQVIAEENVTYLHEAPPIYKKLLNPDDESERPTETEDREVFESIETIATAAAPMSEELFADIKQRIDPDYIYNTYGMTEIFPPYTMLNLRNRDDPAVFGYAEASNDMRIVEIGSRDPTAEVEPGREGEIIIHRDTPGAFQGYLSDYENAGESSEDGWYFTGDACVETEEGHYVVTGRLSSRIKFGGDNIYPKNVEMALASHPAVEDIAVVGIQDDEWGEVPKAYVVASDDVTAEDLREHCVEGDKLEGYKRPREFEFVSTLPEDIDGR